MIKSEGLLIPAPILLPSISEFLLFGQDSMVEAVIFRRVHPQTLHDSFVRKTIGWDELHERERIEANEVSHELLATSRAEISLEVDKCVWSHASVANHLESFLVAEGLASAFQVGEVDFLLPLSWHLQLRHLVVSESSGFVSFESETQNAQRVENVNFRDAQRLALAQIAN